LVTVTEALLVVDFPKKFVRDSVNVYLVGWRIEEGMVRGADMEVVDR